MQLVLDAADRLVELVEERRGVVPAQDAAAVLFALRSAPPATARMLLEDVVRDDARLTWRGDAVALANAAGGDTPLEEATFVVVDLETTGLSPTSSAICEIGAVRVRRLEQEATFQTLVDPRVPLPAAVRALTGLSERELRGGQAVATAVRRLLDFAGDAPLVAHNARFDLAFLDREVERLTGRRPGAPVVDTVWLARRLLAGRAERVGLASLAHFFGTSVEPCHRALPDAQATAEILLALIGLAQERGARTVADLCELAAPRARQVAAKRSLVAGAPSRPGVYLFRDERETVLYVGRARDLRARLRSYFRGERQRPAVEAALGAVARVEWRVLGSELEAAFEELRLIRELRPPANVRGRRADRCVYLGRRRGRIVVDSAPTPWGPLRGRRRAELAARALTGADGDAPIDVAAAETLPQLRRKLRALARDRRYEDAARLRDRIAAVEAVLAELRRLERLRAVVCWLLVPAVEEGFTRAFLVRDGRIADARTLPPGGGAQLELGTGLAAARRVEPSHAAEDADDILLVESFLRRPPPELRVVPVAAGAALAA